MQQIDCKYMSKSHLNTNKQFMIGNGILAFAVICGGTFEKSAAQSCVCALII